MKELQTKLALPLEVFYVKRHINKNMKKNVNNLMDSLKRSVRDQLEKVLYKKCNFLREYCLLSRWIFTCLFSQVDWLDKKTKMVATKKLEDVVFHIASPEELLNDDKLDQLYQSLEIYPDNFLSSVLSLNKFNIKYDIQQLKNPINVTNRLNLRVSPFVVGARNNQNRNSIGTYLYFAEK